MRWPDMLQAGSTHTIDSDTHVHNDTHTRMHGCFAIKYEFLYGNQNGALFLMLAKYNEIIPPGFPGEMNHINRSIVTLSSLWFESHLATYFSCLAGAE